MIPRLLVFESRKLLRQRFPFLAVAATALLGAAVAAAVRLGSSAEALLDAEAAPAGGFLLFACAGGAQAQVAVVLISILAAQSLAGEGEGGSLRHLLTRPLKRRQVVVAKMLLLVGWAFLFAFLSGLASLLAAWGLGGLSGVSERGYEILSGRELASQALLAWASTLLPLAAVAGVGVAASSVSGSTATAAATSISIHIAGVALSAFSGPLREHGPWAWTASPWSVLADLSRGFTQVRLTPEAACRPAVVSAAVLVGCLLFACVVFSRRDLTS